jgi:hypothetical protein
MTMQPHRRWRVPPKYAQTDLGAAMTSESLSSSAARRAAVVATTWRTPWACLPAEIDSVLHDEVVTSRTSASEDVSAISSGRQNFA